MRVTAAIRARAKTSPDELALADDTGSRTWAQVADDLEQAAGALLSVAGGADQRVSALGENVIATLETHAAGLMVGVGTVATSRQLRADEIADQYSDAGVACAITGAAGQAEVTEGARAANVDTVVVHGGEPAEGAISWDRLAGRRTAGAGRRGTAPAPPGARLHLRHDGPGARRRGAVDDRRCPRRPRTTSRLSPQSPRSRPDRTSWSVRCSTTRR